MKRSVVGRPTEVKPRPTIIVSDFSNVQAGVAEKLGHVATIKEKNR